MPGWNNNRPDKVYEYSWKQWFEIQFKVLVVNAA